MSTTDSRPDHDSNTLLGLGSSDGLGPLPPQRVLDRHLPTGVALYGYNADDLRAYAAEQVAAERERCALLANTWAGYFRSFKQADNFAALVRSGPNVRANRPDTAR